MVVDFHHFEYSPPSRSVYMVLKALGIKFNLKRVNLMAQEQKSDEYKKINARAKVPAIVDGNLKLAESRAIASYLCNKYSTGSKKTLYPVAPEKRAIVDMMLYAGEWVAETAVGYVNLSGAFTNGEKPKYEKLDEVKSALAFLEEKLRGQKFVAGDNLTIADFFMLTGITVLELIDFNDYNAYPQFKKWMATMKALKYYDDVNTDAMKGFKEAYQNLIKPTTQTAF